jgi:hypothetical protein
MSGLEAGNLAAQMLPRRHIRNFVPWAIHDSAQSASNNRQTNPVPRETEGEAIEPIER